MVDDRLVTMQVGLFMVIIYITKLILFEAMGHCRPRAFPIARSGLLSWRGLLCACLRREQCKVVRYSGQLERRIPYPGQPAECGELPIRRPGKQDRRGRE